MTEQRKLNVLQPASRPEAAAPQPAEQDDSAAALNPTGAAVPEGDESAEKAAPAEKKSSRSKRGSRREERESVLTADYRINATSLMKKLPSGREGSGKININRRKKGQDLN